MIKLGGLVNLKPITEADVYTATSKETGTTSVFKSKDARDAAIKAGTHEKRKGDKDGGVKDPTDKPKVNIFKRDSDRDSKERLKKKKSEPKSEPQSSKLSSDEKEDLENRANDIMSHDDIRTIIDDYKDKLSPEQLEVLKQAYDEMEEADHLKYDDESAGNEMFDDAFYKIQNLIQSLDENETPSTRLKDLLPEGFINEGTRSQVGIIDRSGKIASGYVHFDGYPSNMKPGLKKHMKNEKDVLNLIKKGGARGIYNDKNIEYFNL